MFIDEVIDVGKSIAVVVVRILCQSGSADGSSVAVVLPWLGTGTTGAVVHGVESPTTKRIWHFGQSMFQFKQPRRSITSSSSAPWGR